VLYKRIFTGVFQLVLVIRYLPFLGVFLLLQATGIRLGFMLQAVATIAVGLIIGFIFSWKFALFILGVMPFIMIGAGLQMRLAKGYSTKNKDQLETAGKVSIRNNFLILIKFNGLLYIRV
jgi:ABC transporter transmembrane region